MGDCKLLCVGISETDYRIVQQALKGSFEILTASTKEHAISLLLEDERIQLACIDIYHGDGQWLQLLKDIKSDNRLAYVRSIILTNSDNLQQEIAGIKSGATDYVRVPLQVESLRARIEMHSELLRQKKNEITSRDQEQLIRAIFWQAPIGIAICHKSEPDASAQDEMFSVNPMFEHITGRTKEELIRLGWAKITHPDDVQADMKQFKKLQSGEIKSYSMEKRYIKPDGSIVWVSMHVAPLNLLHNRIYNHMCLIQDISARKEMEKSLAENERSKSVLLANLPGMAYRCNFDRNWTMQFVSSGCYDLTGYPATSLLYNRDFSYNDLVAVEYRQALWDEWVRVIAEKRPFKGEYEITTAFGKRKWVLEMGQAIYNDSGEVQALEGIVLDISERKKMEEDLVFFNQHDSWTGLFNLRYLERVVTDDLNNKVPGKKAFIAVNVSAVHALSMIFGFQYSHEIIKKVAHLLMNLCNDTYRLFSVYENLFVFYAKGYRSRHELEQFSVAISEALTTLFALERIGWGIGIVEITAHRTRDIVHVLRNLVIASEQALQNFNTKTGDFCYFDDELEQRINRDERITQDLTDIAAKSSVSNILLHVQPILDLKTGQICTFEALARLDSASLGLVSPLEFIPIAEKTKLIIPLGWDIITKSLQFLQTVRDHGYASIGISINISVIQLLHRDFIPQLFDIIERMQVNPGDITLEITESVFSLNFQEVNTILGTLKSHKVKIAIDDFGTGYSSLARERELNVNCLKIDKIFIDKLLTIPEEQTITCDIISMAHKLGHSVVAEGVEHEVQRDYLQRYGCDQIQGYVISVPLDTSKALDFLRDFGKEHR